jgi:hypothetical protein
MGVGELDLAVCPVFSPPPRPIAPDSPFTLPEIPPARFYPPYSGPSLGLKKLIIRLHYPTTIQEDKSACPALSEMAECMLAIGGVWCRYEYGLSGDYETGRLLTEWLSGALNAEMARIMVERQRIKGFTKSGRAKKYEEAVLIEL